MRVFDLHSLELRLYVHEPGSVIRGISALKSLEPELGPS